METTHLILRGITTSCQSPGNLGIFEDVSFFLAEIDVAFVHRCDPNQAGAIQPRRGFHGFAISSG